MVHHTNKQLLPKFHFTESVTILGLHQPSKDASDQHQSSWANNILLSIFDLP
jgi:hypothetical protein